MGFQTATERQCGMAFQVTSFPRLHGRRCAHYYIHTKEYRTPLVFCFIQTVGVGLHPFFYIPRLDGAISADHPNGDGGCLFLFKLQIVITDVVTTMFSFFPTCSLIPLVQNYWYLSTLPLDLNLYKIGKDNMEGGLG